MFLLLRGRLPGLQFLLLRSNFLALLNGFVAGFGLRHEGWRLFGEGQWRHYEGTHDYSGGDAQGAKHINDLLARSKCYSIEDTRGSSVAMEVRVKGNRCRHDEQ